MFKIFLFLALVSAGCGSLVAAKKGKVSIRRVIVCVFLFSCAIGMLCLGLNRILWGIGFVMFGMIALLGVRFTRPEKL